MGALVSWEYVEQFETDGIRALVDVDMEAAPFRWDDSDHGTYDPERLREIHVGIQTDHLEFIESAIDQLLKEPPSASLRRTIFDEESKCPPAIKSAIILDATMRDYRDVLPDVDVPMLVCAGADEKWRSVPAVRDVAESVPEASFELFEESGHCLTLEEPDRFNQVVGDFVDSFS